MVVSKPASSQKVSTRTCRFSFRQDIPVRVVGAKSTGAFAGASGPGAAQVTFAATAPRFKSGPKKGQCNPNGKPHTRGASASFLASVGAHRQEVKYRLHLIPKKGRAPAGDNRGGPALPGSHRAGP